MDRAAKSKMPWWWWPRCGCPRGKCRGITCVLNDACWFTLSALFLILLFAYADWWTVTI